MQETLSMVRDLAGAAIVCIGLAITLVGVVGQWRFPDVYTRVHAARLANGVGSVIALIGLSVLARELGIAFRLLMLAALFAALTPVLSHLTLSAAHHGGLAPLTGAAKTRGARHD